MLTDELAYWGQGSLQTKLDEAYKDFVGYCRVHKLSHSQPPFKVKMDSLKHCNLCAGFFYNYKYADISQSLVLIYQVSIFSTLKNALNFEHLSTTVTQCVLDFFDRWHCLIFNLCEDVFIFNMVFSDISCTLKIGCWRCCPSKVRKSSGEVLLTAKAWNGRVIAQWLAETISIATAGFDVFHDEGRYTLTCHAATCACNFFVWFALEICFIYVQHQCTSYAWYDTHVPLRVRKPFLMRSLFV